MVLAAAVALGIVAIGLLVELHNIRQEMISIVAELNQERQAEVTMHIDGARQEREQLLNRIQEPTAAVLQSMRERDERVGPVEMPTLTMQLEGDEQAAAERIAAIDEGLRERGVEV